MAEKKRYRLKIIVANPGGWLKVALSLAPNALVFVAYNLTDTVLNNVGIANAVLSPFGVVVEITEG